MGHELLISNGRASMMYVGDVPWHGLGTALDSPATAEEAIKAANLDWEVEKRPVYYSNGKALEPVEGKNVVVPGKGWESDEQPVFGIVSDNYQPLQNREAFGFFDPIVGKDAAVYHTAGALGEGERIWVLAKLPGEIRVVGDDITEKYLLLSNSHDGQSSVQIKFTPVRVVCHNTLTMALEHGRSIRVAHRVAIKSRLMQADRLLGIVNAGFERTEKHFKAMTRVPMTGVLLNKFFCSVVPDPEGANVENAKRRAARQRAIMQDLFENGAGNDMPGVNGTLWAAYNGVTQYVDHRPTSASRENHLQSVWFGEGCRLKARAYKAAVDILYDAGN